MTFIIEQLELDKLKDDFNIENPVKSCDISCTQYIQKYIKTKHPSIDIPKIEIYSYGDDCKIITAVYELMFEDSKTLLSCDFEVDSDNREATLINIYYPSQETK